MISATVPDIYYMVFMQPLVTDVELTLGSLIIIWLNINQLQRPDYSCILHIIVSVILFWLLDNVVGVVNGILMLSLHTHCCWVLSILVWFTSLPVHKHPPTHTHTHIGLVGCRNWKKHTCPVSINPMNWVSHIRHLEMGTKFLTVVDFWMVYVNCKAL